MQAITSGVGPSKGQELRRTNESSVAETRRRMKKMKLSGNEHFSLVDEEDETKVNCDLPLSRGRVCPDSGRKRWC